MTLQHTWQNAIYPKQRVQERDLILARAGLCFLGEKQIECMTICPRHRHAFGKFWRPPKH